eukprot:gene6101-6805_t
MACPKTHSIVYTVHKWSSYSANYHPNNVLSDNPHEQSSRWSSDSNYPPQFLILKLNKPSIVTSISFGKYEKSHVCNLRKFKVYGGLNTDYMTELLTGGLKNDNLKESFALKHELEERKFPCKFLKIVPIMSWGPSFNFSIWHVSLEGIDDIHVIRPCLKWYKTVEKGDFGKAESIIEQAAEDGLFQHFIAEQEYEPKWNPIVPLNENGEETTCQPGMRGGHQMCIDAENSIIYLLGGWDGMQDLSDFWAFHCTTGQWQCISTDTVKDGGPSARSCHKICLDIKEACLYTLGRYLDSETRATANLKSDFYKYDLRDGHWQIISEDTAEDGGPNLIFDHQMVYDPVTEKIFVFGGRILTNSSIDERGFSPQFSGMYTYHVRTNTWKKLSDFFTFNLDTCEIKNVLENSENKQVPAAGFTQRSTIDSELNEIYVLSGLSKDKEKREEAVRNSFWVYDIKRGKWSCVYKNENMGVQYWSKMQHLEPCPRFAHQLVYDHVHKTHYLFGGNPGKSSLPKMRLDDFWMLKLKRPCLSYLVRRCKLMIRKHRYKELTEQDPLTAVSFLQTEVSKLVDHFDKAERAEFESLATNLFAIKQASSDSESSSDTEDYEHGTSFSLRGHKHRIELFDELVNFFPDDMVQPKGNLVDLMTV